LFTFVYLEKSVFNMVKYYLLLVAFLFIHQVSFGQSAAISGQVLDQQEGQPISFATITVTRVPDAKIVGGSMTDAQGGQTGDCQAQQKPAAAVAPGKTGGQCQIASGVADYRPESYQLSPTG
jgi:hypothetical protein